MFMHLDLHSILLILFAISLGGLVKGVISFGLPLVALPILSFVLNPKQAIFLLFLLHFERHNLLSRFTLKFHAKNHLKYVKKCGSYFKIER